MEAFLVIPQLSNLLSQEVWQTLTPAIFQKLFPSILSGQGFIIIGVFLVMLALFLNGDSHHSTDPHGGCTCAAAAHEVLCSTLFSEEIVAAFNLHTCLSLGLIGREEAWLHPPPPPFHHVHAQIRNAIHPCLIGCYSSFSFLFPLCCCYRFLLSFQWEIAPHDLWITSSSDRHSGTSEGKSKDFEGFTPHLGCKCFSSLVP